jgi:hypothetical protein
MKYTNTYVRLWAIVIYRYHSQLGMINNTLVVIWNICMFGKGKPRFPLKPLPFRGGKGGRSPLS